MGGRSKIPAAFIAKLDEKRKQTRANFEDDFRDDFVPFTSDDDAGESSTAGAMPTIPVEYAAKVMGGTVLPIGGIEVQFPFKPYPAQIQMMSKAIEALTKSQDALIESPTGSGKSLALLCASLAWQKYDQMARATSNSNTPIESEGEGDEIQILTADEVNKVWGKGSSESEPQVEPESATQDEFQTFQPARLHRKRQRYFDKLDPRVKDTESEPKKPQTMPSKQSALLPKATKIYYASRTHKQISQVVAELKGKTSYLPKMTILGSRDQFCIHPKVSKASNKNEECSKLLDTNRCSYGHNVRKVAGHSSIQRSGNNFIWDIEDLTNIGRKAHGCPYFAAKSLMDVAEIVFCPYNYLIEPLIREAYEINLKDSVVIIDEAHNIEDVARDAASFAIHEKELISLQMELTMLIKNGILVEHHTKLIYIVESMIDWIVDPNNTFSVLEYEHYINSWTGSQIVNKLNGLGINRLTMENDLKPALELVISAANQIRKDKASQVEHDGMIEIGYEGEEFGSDGEAKKPRKKCLSNKNLVLLQGLFVVFGNLFREGVDYAGDYVMVLMKRAHKNRMAFNKGTFGQCELKTFFRGLTLTLLTSESDWEFNLSFWCQNSGVAFKDITDEARSVLLCSGTLSPMSTFSSELQTDLPISDNVSNSPIRLETNHVVDKSQIWAGVIPSGPDRVSLVGSFKTLDTYVYQDDIGNVLLIALLSALLRIAQTVPNGILCFVPSYAALNKFMVRWKYVPSKANWTVVKTIRDEADDYRVNLRLTCTNSRMFVVEPQNVAKSVFEKELNRYYGSVNVNNGSQNGAMLIAVYRGKVSEGIDFSDARCRAVISIGIPFPNLKDFQVISKRDYNTNARKLGKNVLSGDEWYSIQAYRAVNQALGRCIRHRKDWGAIILLEHRFLQTDNINALSKWIRAQCKKHTSGFEQAISELEEFVKMRIQADDIEMDEYVAQAQLQEETVYVSGKIVNENGTLATYSELEDTLPNEADPKLDDKQRLAESQGFIIDFMEVTSDYDASALLDEPSLPQLSHVSSSLVLTGELLGKTRYNITCRQCRMQLGYCIENEDFVVQQKSVSNQYFEAIRQPHPTHSPCYVYELLPNQDWNSSIFRENQTNTITVQWNQQDKICYEDIHCPTCQVSVPNGMGSSIIGARIAVCQSGSAKEITDLLGRVWLLYDAVKIGRSLEIVPNSPAKRSKYI
ncbi:helicase C-terminal domain-containing protein [Umbelopsis sp. PMI_123]|nr:helicase C-terminal domain-containing protein [Umbelopsis sp. PMI_123]